MARSLQVSPQARRALDQLSEDLTRVFGPRLEALVAYAERHSAAFVSTLTADDLDACGPLGDRWHRDGLHTPLVITSDEFRRSLDAFPLEFQTMLDEHIVISGTPPFAGVTIDAVELRRACESQARGFLIHFRQAWIEAAGHHDRLAHCLAASAPQVRALLANIALLRGRNAPADLGAFAHEIAGMPADLVNAVLALEQTPDRASALLPRAHEYLEACERLWSFMDSWPA